MRKIVKQLHFYYYNLSWSFLNVEETKMPTFNYKEARKPETAQKAQQIQDEAEGA